MAWIEREGQRSFYSDQRYKNTNTILLIGIGIRLRAGMPGEVTWALAG